MPLTLRSAFFPLFGTRVWGPLGHFVDTIAVLATLLAVQLGFTAVVVIAVALYLAAALTAPRPPTVSVA